MKREIIESLLMDQSLEELAPDVEELLEAYIAEHPQFQKMAESIQQSAELAKQAISCEVAGELPPFPKERVRCLEKSGRWKLFCGWGFSVAACLLIGAFIGITLTQWQDAGRQQQLTGEGVLAANLHFVPDTRGLESARAFWSAEKYINRVMNNRTAPVENRNQTDINRAMEKYRKRGLI